MLSFLYPDAITVEKGLGFRVSISGFWSIPCVMAIEQGTRSGIHSFMLKDCARFQLGVNKCLEEESLFVKKCYFNICSNNILKKRREVISFWKSEQFKFVSRNWMKINCWRDTWRWLRVHVYVCMCIYLCIGTKLGKEVFFHYYCFLIVFNSVYTH